MHLSEPAKHKVALGAAAVVVIGTTYALMVRSGQAADMGVDPNSLLKGFGLKGGFGGGIGGGGAGGLPSGPGGNNLPPPPPTGDSPTFSPTVLPEGPTNNTDDIYTAPTFVAAPAPAPTATAAPVYDFSAPGFDPSSPDNPVFNGVPPGSGLTLGGWADPGSLATPFVDPNIDSSNPSQSQQIDASTIMTYPGYDPTGQNVPVIMD